jgi:hypothetical protein
MLKIYGASDDLIELEGDVTEEFNVYGEEQKTIGLSDGTLLTVIYDDNGFWRFNILRKPVGTSISKHEGTDIDDDYSDILEIDADSGIGWAIIGDVAR